MTNQNKRQRVPENSHGATHNTVARFNRHREGVQGHRFTPLYKARELRDALVDDYIAFVSLAPSDVAKFDVHPWFAARAARCEPGALAQMVEELGRIATMQAGQWSDIAKCFELAQALTGMEVAYAAQRA